MLKKLLKSFMLFSMIFLLNNSFIDVIAYAAQQNTAVSSETASTSSETTSTVSSGTDNENLKDSTDTKSSKDNSSKSSADSSTSTSDKDDKTETEEFIDYGWKTVDNKKYYIVNNKVLEKTGWFMEKDANKKLSKNSENYKAKYYLDKDFSAVVGWKQIQSNWYYFNSEGIMQTGLILDGDNRYYLDDSGVMQIGWEKIDGYTYYFDQYGHAAVGKGLLESKWYFFDDNGRLEKGFYNYNGKTYYSDQNGVMVTNKWISTSSHKYYIKADSSVAIGNIFIDGVMEKFNKNGYYEGSDSSDKNYLYVHHLNVGNADCAFIKLPSGETVLIDTGDTATTKTLIDFLNKQNLKTEPFQSKIDVQASTANDINNTEDNIDNTKDNINTSSNDNVSTSNATITDNTNNSTNESANTKINNGKGVIDYVVLTHPHSDHIGGMIELMKNFNIGKVLVPKYFELKDYSEGVTVTEENKSEVNMVKHDYEIYKETMDALSKSGIPLAQAKPESYIDSENILKFLNIDKDYSDLGLKNFSGPYWAVNDNSAIVYLNYYDLQELFTGDMQWNSEKDFSSRKALNGGSVDILKVPHHGNVGSSSYTFIGYVKPTIGIISRAKESINTTNEPYDTLTTCGVNIYETSEKDGVSVYATKDNWSIEDK